VKLTSAAFRIAAHLPGACSAARILCALRTSAAHLCLTRAPRVFHLRGSAARTSSFRTHRCILRSGMFGVQGGMVGIAGVAAEGRYMAAFFIALDMFA
jgi:hypothetical protein